MPQVSLVKCENYIHDNVALAVQQCIDLLGGIKKFVKKGQTVFLKVNLVSKCNIDKAITTHPEVVCAVAQLVKDAGCNVVIGDSAGGPYNKNYMGGIYKSSGMTDISEQYGFELNNNYEIFEAKLPDAIVGKKFFILDALQKADVIINISKLKTHSFTGMTNAVKNMFGAIPGLTKVEMHGKYRTLDVFGDFLFDIQEYFKDKLVLNVCDAVVAMEGPGPTGGSPRQIGAIFAGSNATACDIVGAKLMNGDPQKMPIIQSGVKRGFIAKNCEVEVLGAKVADLVVKDFDLVVPDNFKPFANSMPKWMQGIMHRLSTQRPSIKRKSCKGCGKCAEHCPVQAIEMIPDKKENISKASIDYNKCIRCYCCQELCPFHVVKIKSGILYKLTHLGSKKKSK